MTAHDSSSSLVVRVIARADDKASVSASLSSMKPDAAMALESFGQPTGFVGN
jgi:hypothetical protein